MLSDGFPFLLPKILKSYASDLPTEFDITISLVVLVQDVKDHVCLDGKLKIPLGSAGMLHSTSLGGAFLSIHVCL